MGGALPPPLLAVAVLLLPLLLLEGWPPPVLPVPPQLGSYRSSTLAMTMEVPPVYTPASTKSCATENGKLNRSMVSYVGGQGAGGEVASELGLKKLHEGGTQQRSWAVITRGRPGRFASQQGKSRNRRVPCPGSSCGAHPRDVAEQGCQRHLDGQLHVQIVRAVEREQRHKLVCSTQLNRHC